jgi:hypothetical protein
MIIDNLNKKTKTDEKMFEMLNEIKLTEEDEFNNINVTDEDIRIIKSKVYKNIRIKPKNIVIKKFAIAASMAILLSIPLYNFNTVWANIKNVLQFVPGIGMVEKTGAGGEHYMLNKMINNPYSNGKIIIRGFDIDNKNATLSIDGDKIPYFHSVEIEDSDGKVYKMNEFAHGYISDSSNKTFYWSKTYKYSGDIKTGKDYTVILDKKTKIPMSLVVDNDIKSLNNLGPTVNIAGVNLTAVSAIEDNKLKIDILAPQNNSTKSLYYPNSHISITTNENHLSKDLKNRLINMENMSPIYLTDDTGNKYTAYMSPNMSLGGHEYYFRTGNAANKQYTLTISKILVSYDSKTPFSFNLPSNGENSQKQIVNIAGYPVGLSITKINDTKVRVNVDLNYNKNLKKNLISFGLSSTSIKNDAVFSMTSMKSDLSSSPNYFEFNVNKNIKQLNLEFTHLLIEEQGPWNFNIKLKQ